jgi:hypothetical protein
VFKIYPKVDLSERLAWSLYLKDVERFRVCEFWMGSWEFGVPDVDMIPLNNDFRFLPAIS